MAIHKLCQIYGLPALFTTQGIFAKSNGLRGDRAFILFLVAGLTVIKNNRYGTRNRICLFAISKFPLNGIETAHAIDRAEHGSARVHCYSIHNEKSDISHYEC